MKETVEEIYSLMDEFKKQAQEFTEKNKAIAARRARKVTMELTKKLKDFRKTSVDAEKDLRASRKES